MFTKVDLYMLRHWLLVNPIDISMNLELIWEVLPRRPISLPKDNDFTFNQHLDMF